MKETNEIPSPIKELNEAAVDSQGIFSSELTRQEADDRVAALLETRRVMEEGVNPVGEYEAIGLTATEISKMKSLASDAENAQRNANLQERELNSLKSKRARETDSTKKSELDRKISAQEKKVKAAKDSFKDKDKAYRAYVNLVTSRRL